MCEKSKNDELESVIERVSGHIGKVMSRWPLIEISLEQSVWTINQFGFDKAYPIRNEDKLLYIKKFLKNKFVPIELQSVALPLLSRAKGILGTRNILAHSYVFGFDNKNQDVLFKRIVVKSVPTKYRNEKIFKTELKKRKIGVLKKHAEECVALSFEMPYLRRALREQLKQ